MKKISIMIPCYNEEENIVQIGEACEQVLKEQLSEYDYEICYVDNASSDRTRELIEEVCSKNKKFKAIFNVTNFGQFNSPFHGMCALDGDCVIPLCADFQDPVELIPVFVHEWEKGHKIVIASGRPTPGIKWIVDKLKLREYGGYALCFNGAKVIDFETGEIIYQNIFPRECIAPLYEYALAHNMGMITYEGDTVIHGTRADDYMRFEANLNFMELKAVDDFANYVTFDVNKCLFTAPPDIAPKLEKEMADIYKNRLSIYRSEEFFIEAMPLGVDKAASLDRLFTAIGVDVKDTVAVGDGFNDMSMIKYANVGVCMKNGQQAVKDVADYVTKLTNDEDGLCEVIDKFIYG